VEPKELSGERIEHPALLSWNAIAEIILRSYPEAQVPEVLNASRAIADAAARKVVAELLRVGNRDVITNRFGCGVVFVIPIARWQALREAVGLGEEK